MQRVTYDRGQVIENRTAVGIEWVIKNGAGVEIGREDLTPEELIQFQNEGKATPDETLVTDLNAATTIADLKDALLARFGT